MIKVKEAIELQKEAMRKFVEDGIIMRANKRFSDYAMESSKTPSWLIKELEEAGFTIIEEDSIIRVSWKVGDLLWKKL